TLLIALVGVIGFTMGRAGGTHVEEVECFAGEGAISCALDDGWDVSVPLDVAWTDEEGSFHGDGRPGCLPPSGRGLQGPVRVQWTEVEADDVGWRQVVWVGC